MIDDQMDELFQQLLDDGYPVEQAADLASQLYKQKLYREFNKWWVIKKLHVTKLWVMQYGLL